jgi:hypothetical protein
MTSTEPPRRKTGQPLEKPDDGKAADDLLDFDDLDRAAPQEDRAALGQLGGGIQGVRPLQGFTMGK